MKSAPSAITPNELATRWGISVRKVIAFIDRGELVALNLAVDPHGEKPRYRITETEIAAFEERRRSQPKAAPAPRRHQKKTGVIEFY